MAWSVRTLGSVLVWLADFFEHFHPLCRWDRWRKIPPEHRGRYPSPLWFWSVAYGILVLAFLVILAIVWPVARQ